MGRPWRGGFWIALAAAVIRPLSCLLTRRRWSGQGNIPASGGVILVANHLSTVDPPLLAHYVYAAGRSPRFMAKSDLWEVPILRRVLAGAGQIPVYRRDPSAGGALRDAVAALRAGRALVIYPEGGITTDPDYWPMRARTGVARLALATGAPVIPVAQWGAQRIWGRDRRPHLFARPEIRVHAGRPVDLSRFAARSGAPTDPSGAWLLREVTDVVMADLTAVVELVRGEPAPPPVGSAEPGPEIPGQPEAAASPGARPPDPDAPRAGSAR